MSSDNPQLRGLARRLGNPIGDRRSAAAEIFGLVSDYRALAPDNRELVRQMVDRLKRAQRYAEGGER